jgi:hypothetical protein
MRRTSRCSIDRLMKVSGGSREQLAASPSADCGGTLTPRSIKLLRMHSR